MQETLAARIRGSDFFETLKHSKNYFSANVALRAVSLVSIPIFTRLLTQADYGILATYNAYVNIFLVILSLNAYSAVGRYYYEDRGDFDEFLGSTFTLLGLILVLTISIYAFAFHSVGQLLELPGYLPLYLVGACAFRMVDSIYEQVLIPQKRSREAALLRVARGYGGVAVAVVLVLLLSEDRYLGQVWGGLLVGFAASIYIARRLRGRIRFTLNWEHIKYILAFSLPLIPRNLSGIILAQFDRIMVKSTIDASAAGLYSLGYNVGMLLHLAIAASNSAVDPDFYRFQANGEYARINNLIRKVFGIILLAALFLILFAREIVVLLADPKFHEGMSVVPAVVVGYVFYALGAIYSRYILYEKKTLLLSITVLAAGIANIVLNAIYIPRYGYVAAAYTTVACYFLLFVLNWIVARVFITMVILPLWVVGWPLLLFSLALAAASLLTGMELGLFGIVALKLGLLLVLACAVFSREVQKMVRHGRSS